MIIFIFVLSKLGINLLIINFIGKLMVGVVYIYYGGIILIVGIKFLFGLLFIFYLEMFN